MNKVTVEQFLNAGFKFVKGDVVNVAEGLNYEVKNPECWHEPDGMDIHRYVVKLIDRPSTGTQPVADDCVVEVAFRDGSTEYGLAGQYVWSISGDIRHKVGIFSWKPSLKHLEQQMNDKQESAMNISERDIEDAFIQQEDAAVERELAESDEWVSGRPNVGDEFISNTNRDLVMTCSYSSKYVVIGQTPTHQITNGEVMDVVFNMFSKIKYEFSKQLTPEQVAAKERELAIDQMWADTAAGYFSAIHRDSELWSICSRVYDAGYRK